MSCTLNAPKPLGTVGSTKAPGVLSLANEPSNTWMPPLTVSAAYRRVPAPLMARPVYTAPGVVASMVALAPPAQPEIVPFRLAKMKRDDVAVLPGASWNDAVFDLLTCPVGPSGPAAVVGIATNPLGAMLTRVTVVLPVMPYSVALLVAWFETQKGLVALLEIPQGFTINGSVMVARPGM